MTTDTQKQVIKDYPTGLWLAGAGSTVMSLVIAAFVASQAQEMLWPVIFSTVFGLPMILFASVLTVSVDSASRLLNLRYRSVLHHAARDIPIDEVDTVIVTSGRSRRGSRSYRVEIVLKSGERVPLRSYFSSGRGGKDRLAEQIRAALGVSARSPAPVLAPASAAQPAAPAAPGRQLSGTTDGVSWQIETITMGTAPVTRWRSADVTFPGHFLLLIQKPAGQEMPGWMEGLMGGLSNMLVQQVIGLYGFSAADTPGFESARPLEALDPRLDPHFMARTTDLAGARQLLNPWVVQPLAAWAQQHPVKQFQTMGQGEAGQLVVLFAPGALYAATFGALPPAQLDELTRLGADLARAQGLPSGGNNPDRAW